VTGIAHSSSWFTGKVRNVRYLRAVVRSIRNWPPFILDYLGLRRGGRTYYLRDGSVIKTHDATEASNIAVIFLKQDYGVVDHHTTVIDIGANIGIFAVYAAKTAAGTTVYAFEPGESSYRTLVENVRLNGLEGRVRAFPLAVAATTGKRTLFLSEHDSYHSLYAHPAKSRPIEINCISLQEIFDQHQIAVCDLLKLDCEGAEFEILYQTPPEYLRRVKHIRMEYHNHASHEQNTTIDALLPYLQGQGFAVTRVDKETEWSGIVWLARA